MVAFSDEVISSYAVPRKPFWGRPVLERTMRCLGGMLQVCIGKYRYLRTEGGWTQVRLLAVVDNGREIFRGLGTATAQLAFHDTRTIYGPASRKSSEDTRTRLVYFVGGLVPSLFWSFFLFSLLCSGCSFPLLLADIQRPVGSAVAKAATMTNVDDLFKVSTAIPGFLLDFRLIILETSIERKWKAQVRAGPRSKYASRPFYVPRYVQYSCARR